MKDKSLRCVIYTGMWVDALSIIAIRNERMRRQFQNKCLKNYLFETHFFDECMALNQAEHSERERERFLN